MKIAFQYHITDKATEILTLEKFKSLVNSEEIRTLLSDYRSGKDPNAKRKLPVVTWQSYFSDNKRSNKSAVANGLFMADFDHLTKEEFSNALAIATTGAFADFGIYVIHETPSGGLRIVADRKGRDIATAQKEMAELLELSEKLDKHTHDLARASFLVPWHMFTLLDKRIFDENFEAQQTPAEAAEQKPKVEDAGQADETDISEVLYKNFNVKDFAKKWFIKTGGMPVEGERNSRLYECARVIRYICDFNVAKMSLVLSDYGLPQTEVHSLCESAIQSTRASKRPKVIDEILAEMSNEEDDEADYTIEDTQLSPSYLAYNMPIGLPPIIRPFVQNAPKDYKAVVAMAALPMVGTILSQYRFSYLDKREQSLSFFTVIEAPQASGKSFTRVMYDILMAKIIERDNTAREVEQQYLDELRKKKNSKDQPSDPQVVVRIIPASVSIAKLLKRMKNAAGLHLFSYDEEMDTLIKTNQSGAWAQKSDIYRKAFDNAEIGQDYMSDNSFSTVVKAYYNLLICGTPKSVARFFRDPENGLVSRTIFAEIPDQFAKEMPVFKKLTRSQVAGIEAFVTKYQDPGMLNSFVQTKWLDSTFTKWLEARRNLALNTGSRAIDIFRRRAAVIGYRAAVLSHILYDQNPSTVTFSRNFGVWVADYVLSQLVLKYGSQLESVATETPNAATKFVNLFSRLPKKFSTGDLTSICARYKTATPPRMIIYSWKKAGLIEKLGKGEFNKLK